MLTRNQAAFLSLKKHRDEKCHEHVYNSSTRKYIYIFLNIEYPFGRLADQTL